MVRIVKMLLLMTAALALVACGEDDDSEATPASAGQGDGERISVIATTAQIGALVEEIAGDLVDLFILMPPGVDPHDYEITPGDLRAIGNADLILKNGIGLDDFLDDNIEAAGGNAELIVVTDGIDLVEGGHHHHHDDDNHGHDNDDDDHGHDHDDDDHGHDHDADNHGHSHGEHDPHVWHDPANAITMVDNIVVALSDADRDNVETFEARGEAYKTVLEETDTDIRDLLDEIPEEHRKLVTTHDAFGYFIHAYDFTFIGAVVPGVSTDAEPSAQEMAALSDLIRDENVKAIFAEDTVDPRIAEQLANDTGVEIVYGLHSDSLGEPGSGQETIHGMLLANATLIYDALK